MPPGVRVAWSQWQLSEMLRLYLVAFVGRPSDTSQPIPLASTAGTSREHVSPCPIPFPYYLRNGCLALALQAGQDLPGPQLLGQALGYWV